MLPTLPRFRRACDRARARLLATGLAIAALAIAGPAHALDLEFESTRHEGGYLWAEIRIDDPVPSRVEDSLARGMPATLQLHSELWRRRTAWFDRLEDSFDAELRVRYDTWGRAYRIERRGAATETYSSLDSLRAALGRPLALRVARDSRLQPGGRYFVVVAATLKPLDVQDVEEVEGWLSGEVESKRHSGFGVFTELPRSLFDTVRNFAGFGDIRDRAISPDFVEAKSER